MKKQSLCDSHRVGKLVGDRTINICEEALAGPGFTRVRSLPASFQGLQADGVRGTA